MARGWQQGQEKQTNPDHPPVISGAVTNLGRTLCRDPEQVKWSNDRDWQLGQLWLFLEWFAATQTWVDRKAEEIIAGRVILTQTHMPIPPLPWKRRIWFCSNTVLLAKTRLLNLAPFPGVYQDDEQFCSS